MSLHLDREGPVPESPAKRTRTGSSSASRLRYRSQLRPLLNSGLINWRVRKGNPNHRKAQSKQLEPFQRWRTHNFRYVEKVCENRHPTLVKANRAYGDRLPKGDTARVQVLLARRATKSTAKKEKDTEKCVNEQQLP